MDKIFEYPSEKDPVYFLKVSANRREKEILIETYKDDHHEPEARIRLVFDNNAAFKTNFEAPEQLMECLLSCGLSLVGEVYECWRQSKANWDDFTECLRGKRQAIGVSFVACMAKCMMGL